MDIDIADAYALCFYGRIPERNSGMAPVVYSNWPEDGKTDNM
jgi:hypothetical protein